MKSTDAATNVSIYDVARKAGVSIVTVSRVFNDYPHVSDKMRERVFAASREVGYTPRLISKPRILAVIVGHLENLNAGGYKTRLIQHIIRYASESGFYVEFIPFSAIELATKRLVDGIIEVGLTEEELNHTEDLPTVPTVVINKRPRSDSWYMIGSDHTAEATLAADHLLAAGHRSIAMVLDEREGWGVENRQNGYRETLLKHGIEREHVFAVSEQTPLEIARQIRDAGCTACINFSDNQGFALMDALMNELDISIPSRMSVVALENETLSPYFHPRLTTISQPLEAIAEAAVETLVHYHREDTQPAHRRIFDSRLMERASVKPPPS